MGSRQETTGFSLSLEFETCTHVIQHGNQLPGVPGHQQGDFGCAVLGGHQHASANRGPHLPRDGSGHANLPVRHAPRPRPKPVSLSERSIRLFWRGTRYSRLRKYETPSEDVFGSGAPWGWGFRARQRRRAQTKTTMYGPQALVGGFSA